MDIMDLPGFVVLGRAPAGNAYRGIVEHSFSMDLSMSNVAFWFTRRNVTTNLGSMIKPFDVDGMERATHYRDHFTEGHADMEFEIFNARDDDALPIIINWEAWCAANERADTLSGVRNKFVARNPPFEMK